MSHYKLYYFDARGLAETTRQLFVLAGQQFEDVRFTIDGWPKHKHEMPFGQLPVMEVDGRMIPESWAIARYVARQFGLAGKDEFEGAWVDAFGDQLKEHYQELRPLHNVLFGFQRGDKETLREVLKEPIREKFFSLIEKQLKANNRGFLIGDSVTWIDIALAEHVDVLLGFLPNILDDYPEVLAHHKKVRSLPKIMEWLTLRPEKTATIGTNPATDPTLEQIREAMERKAMEEGLLLREHPTRCSGHPTNICVAKTEHEA